MNPALKHVNFERSLYVACALNDSTDEYKQQVEGIRQTLEVDYGLNILRFRGLGNHTARDVYTYDMGLVLGCTAFLGIYGYLSDGRGMETETAFRRGIPMLGVVKRGEMVSKMITGGYEHYDQPFLEVDDLRTDVPALVAKHIVAVHGVL